MVLTLCTNVVMIFLFAATIPLWVMGAEPAKIDNRSVEFENKQTK